MKLVRFEAEGRNGIVRQDDNTTHLTPNVPEILEFFSKFLTLLAGTVSATGALRRHRLGNGSRVRRRLSRPEGLEGDPYLHSGDRVDCLVESVGTLTNVVA